MCRIFSDELSATRGEGNRGGADEAETLKLSRQHRQPRRQTIRRQQQDKLVETFQAGPTSPPHKSTYTHTFHGDAALTGLRPPRHPPSNDRMAVSATAQALSDGQKAFANQQWHEAVSQYQKVLQTPVEASSDEQLLRDKEAAIIGLGRSYAKLKWVDLRQDCILIWLTARILPTQRPASAGASSQRLQRVHHQTRQGEDGQAGAHFDRLL